MVSVVMSVGAVIVAGVVALATVVVVKRLDGWMVVCRMQASNPKTRDVHGHGRPGEGTNLGLLFRLQHELEFLREGKVCVTTWTGKECGRAQPSHCPIVCGHQHPQVRNPGP